MRVLTVLLTAGLLAAGCSGESAEEAAETVVSEPTTTEPATSEDEGDVPDEESAPAEADATETTTTTAVDVMPAPVELAEPDWASLERRAIPVLGGLTLGVPTDHVVHHDGNMAIIRAPFEADAGRYLPSMVVAMVSQGPDGAPLRTIDELTSTPIRGVGRAEPTGESIELFGLTLDRWSFAAPAARVGPHYLYPAYPNGNSGNSAWQPFPYGELFFGETPDGVVAVGWVGTDSGAMADARAIFDAVAPTLELATPLPTTASPPVELAVSPPFEVAPPAVEIPVGFPDELRSGYQAIQPASYSMSTLATPLAFEVDDSWWVQNNFLSQLDLTAIDSFGPGDRSLTFRTGIDGVAAFDSSYRPTGVTPIDDVSALVADPPTNMVISESEVQVDGRSVQQLDIEVVPTSNCGAADICEYQFTTPYAYPGVSIRAGIPARVWVVSEGAATPIWIFAQAADPAWFDHAEEVVMSIELS